METNMIDFGRVSEETLEKGDKSVESINPLTRYNV
jgi:hypothetical protein